MTRRGCWTLALGHFGDGDGGFHDTADDAEQLFTRPRSQADNAEPSGSSARRRRAAHLRRADRVDRPPRGGGARRWRPPARWPPASRASPGGRLAVAEAAAAGPLQVAVVGEDDARRRTAGRSPGGHPPRPGRRVRCARRRPGVPLLADRPLVDGRLGGLRLPGLRLRPARHRDRPARRGPGRTTAVITGRMTPWPAHRGTHTRSPTRRSAGLSADRRQLFAVRLDRWWPDLRAGLQPAVRRRRSPTWSRCGSSASRRPRYARPRSRPAPPRPAADAAPRTGSRSPGCSATPPTPSGSPATWPACAERLRLPAASSASPTCT